MHSKLQISSCPGMWLWEGEEIRDYRVAVRNVVGIIFVNLIVLVNSKFHMCVCQTYQVVHVTYV